MEVNTPAEFDAVRRECLSRVKFYVDLANKKLNVGLRYPRVDFSLKGTTAGKAWAGKNLIQFSGTLLRENVEDFLKQTVGHEVAHLVARIQHPTCDPHGAEWRRVMWAFSLPATRCHSYDTTNVSSRVGRVRRTPQASVTTTGIVVPIGVGKIIEFD